MAKTTEHLSMIMGVPQKRLRFLAATAGRRYRRWRKPKKSGGYRELSAPGAELKWIQKLILTKILDKVALPACVHGCRKGHSIKTHAAGHLGLPYHLSLDIRDFFPSVHHTRVRKLFARLGFDSGAANILARLTTDQHHLPQGAPTSPAVANLILSPFVRFLRRLPSSGRAARGTYLDDIDLSSGSDLAPLINTLVQALRRHGFRIATNKMRCSGPGEDHLITGLLIKGNRLEVPPDYISRVSAEISDLHNHVATMPLPELSARIRSLGGKVRHVARFCSAEGASLRQRLDNARAMARTFF